VLDAGDQSGFFKSHAAIRGELIAQAIIFFLVVATWVAVERWRYELPCRDSAGGHLRSGGRDMGGSGMVAEKYCVMPSCARGRRIGASARSA
jgi:hypothetical protein